MMTASTGNCTAPPFLARTGPLVRATRKAAAVLLLLAAGAALCADMTLDQAWERLSAYTVGADREAIFLIQRHIADIPVDSEERSAAATRLVKVLSTGTDDARLFACRQLARIGDSSNVPAIANLLKQDSARQVQMACLALGGIGGARTKRELRAALTTAKNETLPDIIQTLGMLRDPEAVPALVERLGSGSAPVTDAAAWALAGIGTREAGEALLRIGPQPDSASLIDARLHCIERLIQEKDQAFARKMAAFLWASKVNAKHRGAVLRALVRTGHPEAPANVIKSIASDNPRLAGTAANLLIRVFNKANTESILAEIRGLQPGTQAQILNALAAGGQREILPFAEESLESPDTTVKLAAIRAVGLLGGSRHVPDLVSMADDKEKKIAETALASLARLPGPGTDRAILDAVRQTQEDTQRMMIQVAAERQTPGLKKLLWEITESDPARGRITFRALGKLADAEDAGRLIRLLNTEMTDGVRSELEAAVAVSIRKDEDSASAALGQLVSLWKSDAPAAVRASVPRILPRIGGEQGLEILRQALKEDTPELRLEAIRALTGWPGPGSIEDMLSLAQNREDKVGHTLAVCGLKRVIDQRIGPAETRIDIARRLVELSDHDAVRDWAEAQAEAILLEQAEDLALKHIPERSARRRQELADAAEDDWKLVCYLDCGPDREDGGRDGPTLKMLKHEPWIWKGSFEHADIRAGTIAFSNKSSVSAQATGLDPGKSYRLGLTWWDYDGNGRIQSVSVSQKKVIKPTRLPSYRKKEPPATLYTDLPGPAYASGKAPIEIIRAGPSNTVLSEIWLYESDQPPEEEKTVKRPPRDPNAKRILIITGEDYKGHRWQLTAPVLEEELSRDTRLAVDVVEDLTFLRSEKLNDYAAVVMHFKNYDPEIPGRTGFDNLVSFVKNGGGLVLVHFAGGAFQEFKEEFAPVAGRVWNPELRAHDKFGTFTVNIAEPEHLITKGITDFQTTDELYTCLEGDTPVNVLASAVSRVDGKTYPMLFTLEYGKGRVAHCPLGHNVDALSNPPVAELFRRSTAWSARLRTLDLDW